MPGRDITRLPNRAARILLFLALGILASYALSQAAVPQSQTAPPQNPPAQAPDNQTKQNQDQNLNDQGVFVFKKDVDEVMLHATVVDDKQHIVTNLDRTAFTIF